ncbi:MAG TPA: LamG-like jellyroll fold domain-containing protein [Verrucomicrobiae bacterium]
MDKQRLEKLLDRFVDGAITPEEKSELERMLLSSPQARQIFWEHARFNALVRRFGEEEWGRKLATASVTPAEKASQEETSTGWFALWTGWHRALAGFAMVALIVAALWMSGVFAPKVTTAELPDEPDYVEEIAPTGIAVLSRAIDVEWETGDVVFTVGAPLEPGRLKLKQGFAELEFYSGARVVVEGPAEIDLISVTEVNCHQGRLSAHVPSQARGFTVQTPNLKVVDIGTAFGVDVTSERTEAHVFEGHVQVTPKGMSVARDMIKGEAVAVNTLGSIEPIPVNPMAFATPGELDSKEAIVQTRQFAEWKQTSQRWRSWPGLLVYYDFQPPSEQERTLRNVSSTGPHESDGAVIGARWTEGRWPMKRALEFKALGDRVRARIPGEFKSLTLHAWIRVDGLKRSYNSLMMGDGFDDGRVHWQIHQDGKVILCIKGTDEQTYRSPVIFTRERFGQWTQITSVFDGEKKKVRFYVDGVQVNEMSAGVKSPLKIGDMEIANWNTVGYGSGANFRNWNGRMDEFAMFDRALTADEVQELYRAGNKQAVQVVKK